MNFTTFRIAMTATGFCLLASPAFAHAHLTSARPAMDGTVAQSPTELDLGFSEGVNLAFTGVKVLRADRSAVVVGAPSLGPAGATALVVPIVTPLAAGRYTVEWHALATDGHKSTGSYTFTIAP